MTRSAYFEYLAAKNIGVLETVTSDGRPQGAAIGHADTDKREIVFDAVHGSRKQRNRMANFKAGFTVCGDAEDTVQIDGDAVESQGDIRKQNRPIYRSTLPDGANRLGRRGNTHSVLRPSWSRFSDFSRKPPVIREVALR